MATTTKYFITDSPGTNFIDFGLNYGSLSLQGQEIEFSGTAAVDAVFVHPGLTFDFTASKGSQDKLYLEGNFADYTIALNSASGVMTLTRGTGALAETIRFAKGPSATASDVLVFADGTVNSYDIFNYKNGGAIPTPSGETSKNPQAPALPGTALDATVSAFAIDPAGETFALTRPGIDYATTGSAGVDTVYVSRGATVDATALRGGRDDIYFTGKWGDYTKTVGSGVITFTRSVDGNTEWVKVAAGVGANNDRLIFADGAINSNDAKNNPTAPIETIPGYDPTVVIPLPAAPVINMVAGDDTINLVESTTAAITGTSSPHARIALTLGKVGVDDNVRTVTADANGVWSYNLVDADRIAMGEGQETIKAVATDTAGNPSPAATRAITIDTIAPTAPTSLPAGYQDNVGSITSDTSNAATTDDTTPGLNIGALPAGVTGAVLYVDGNKVDATYDPATGRLTPTNPLGDGPHTLGYGYVDAAGNPSASSPTLSLTVDTIAPTAPTTAPPSYQDNVGIITSDTSTAATTDDKQPGLNIGALPAGVTGAVLFVDGNKVEATYDPATGRLTPTNPLGDGPHTLGYGYVDAAGNTSDSSPTLSLTVDTIAPTAPTTAPPSYQDNVGIITSDTSTAATTDDKQPGLNIGALPAGVTGAALFVNGSKVEATYDPATGRLTPTNPLGDGTYTLGYGYIDAAGNTSDPSPTLSLTVDTSPPNNITAVNVTAISPDTGAADFITSVPTLTVNGTYSGTLATGDVIQVSNDNGSTWENAAANTLNNTWSLVDPDTHASGTFNYQVRVIDQAGNIGTATDSQAVTITTALTMTSTLDNIANLDVTSNLVLTAGEAVTAVAGKYIHIVNDGGPGFHGENTVHTQDILVTSSMVTISGNKIIINPGFDLDLANNYHITIDEGAFVGVTSGLSSTAITDSTALNFSTVTPGSTAVANAAASQMMQADGSLVAGRLWLDLEGIGTPSSSSSTPLDLSGGNYAGVFKDYDPNGGTPVNDGVGVGNAFPRLNSFGAGDLLYIDDQWNNPAAVNDLAMSCFTQGQGTTSYPLIWDVAGTGVTGGLGAKVEIVLDNGLTASDATLEAMRTALSLSTNPVISG